MMSIADRIFEQAKDMPEEMQKQVLDFALFLRHKEKQQLDTAMDRIIDENLEAFQELAK